MLRATFLGHHGWLCEHGDRRLLCDPLLDERFGHTDAVELRVYPPRSIDLPALPPVDAVFLSHEHEGHFDLRSLLRIDRRVPIYASARSSRALFSALGELGFEVRAAHGGDAIAFDGLTLRPMAADQVRDASIEEWDSLAYLVHERDSANGLFASVDMPPTPAMVKLARSVMARPPVWAHTVNHYGHHFSYSWMRPERRALQREVQRIVDWQEQLRPNWRAPSALLVIGGGFAFGGAQRWLNANAFTAEGEQVALALAPLFPDEQVRWPLPGDTLVIDGGELKAIEPSPFVRPLPRGEWPSRQLLGQVDWLEEYAPATGRATLRDDELPDLGRELDAWAAHLYGRRAFRALCSLTARSGSRRDTFALLLRADAVGGAFVYEYDLAGCRFVPSSSTDPVGDYLAVHECWATDLLATLRGEISQTAITFGRFRTWSADPASLPLDLNSAAFEYAHPLRQPARWLELYRAAAARFAAEGVRPVVAASPSAMREHGPPRR